MRFVALFLALIPFTSQRQYTRPLFGRRFRYFDDYLQSLNSKEQEFIERVEKGFEIEGSGDTFDSMIDMLQRDTAHGKVPDFMNKKKGVCCALGIMAGDKGYHCYVDFYKARIIARNQNRAHNRKIIFGTGEIKKSKEKLMKMFVQCVSSKRNTFHKCCHHATLKIPSYDHYDTRQAKKYSKKMIKNKQGM